MIHDRFYLPAHMVTERFRKRHYLMPSICTRAQMLHSLMRNFNVDFIVKILLKILICRHKSSPAMKRGRPKMCWVASHVRKAEWFGLLEFDPIYKYFHDTSRYFKEWT